MSPKTRAKPLSPEQRREAILDAVVPLLLERGASVTTAEMAEAAHIAEGTIFRVFPDKAALLHAAMKQTLDPEPVQAALAGIDPDLPLRDQLIAAATALSNQFDRATALLGVLRSIPHEKKPTGDSHRVASESMAAVVASLAALLDSHRDRLIVEPAQAAIVLRGLIFTNSHSLLTSEGKMEPTQIVDILLDGILDRKGDPC